MDYREGQAPQEPPAEQTGLMGSLAGMARHFFGLLVSRIELAALELGDIRDNLARFLLAGMAGLVAAWFALACWTGLVIVLAWDAMGWKILLLVALFYSVLAVGVLMYARSLIRRERLSMPATMAELRKDREALL